MIESNKKCACVEASLEGGKVLSEDVTQAIKNKEAIATSDASCKGECMAGAWIIEDDHEIVSDKSTFWSNEWNQNIAVAAEALMILDSVQMVAQTIGKDDAGSMNMHADCKLLWEFLTVNMIKASQRALNGGSTMSRNVEIKSNNKIQFECTHVKTKQDSNENHNSKLKSMVLKCDVESKES